MTGRGLLVDLRPSVRQSSTDSFDARVAGIRASTDDAPSLMSHRSKPDKGVGTIKHDSVDEWVSSVLGGAL